MSQFDESIINQVWEKGTPVPNFDPLKFRKDICGAWIVRESLDNQTSTFGWEINHIIPVSKGGTDQIENLQPLQWQNSNYKGENYPEWTCIVTSVENRNELIIPATK